MSRAITTCAIRPGVGARGACQFLQPARGQDVGSRRLGHDDPLARQMGITRSATVAAMVGAHVGGGEVRLLDMATAYGAFANGGLRVEPVAVAHVTDGARQLRYQWVFHSGDRVLDERVAYLITSILSDDKARAPAFGEGSVLKIDRPAAAKTGTTSTGAITGRWLYAGFGRGVWWAMRYHQWRTSPASRARGRSGTSSSRRTARSPGAGFREPPGLTREQVCAMSGLPPNPDAPCRTRAPIVHRRQQPTQLDTFYRRFKMTCLPGDWPM